MTSNINFAPDILQEALNDVVSSSETMVSNNIDNGLSFSVKSSDAVSNFSYVVNNSSSNSFSFIQPNLKKIAASRKKKSRKLRPLLISPLRDEKIIPFNTSINGSAVQCFILNNSNQKSIDVSRILPKLPQTTLNKNSISGPSNMENKADFKRNSIKLIQQEPTYQSIQTLNKSQLCEILEHVNNDMPVKDRKIHNDTSLDNDKTQKKYEEVLYPANILLENNLLNRKDTVMDVDTSDDEAYNDDDDYYFANKKLNQGSDNHFKRTQNRIRSDIKKSAKKLKNEFGFSNYILQNVKPEDKATMIDVSENKFLNAEEENMSVSTALCSTMTRCGRVSRPPTNKDYDIDYCKSTSMAVSHRESVPLTINATTSKVVNVTPNIKRKPNIKSTYKCRICGKLYLGNKKMLCHIRKFPGHGPLDESILEPQKRNLHSFTTVPISNIIPIARTQLEDLVKNLDAELVLDVVAKKMFDNFTMWQLHHKKTSLKPEKGIKRLTSLISDIENTLGHLKSLVDNCLTVTKLCDNELVDTLQFGEYLQAALNVHDGPWYLEHANQIRDEYLPIIGLPSKHLHFSHSHSSDFTGIMQDEDSGSLVSSGSYKNHSIETQVVLERNLGAQSCDEDGTTKTKHDQEEFMQLSSCKNIPFSETTNSKDSDNSISPHLSPSCPGKRLPAFATILGCTASDSSAPQTSSTYINGSPSQTSNVENASNIVVNSTFDASEVVSKTSIYNQCSTSSFINELDSVLANENNFTFSSNLKSFLTTPPERPPLPSTGVIDMSKGEEHSNVQMFAIENARTDFLGALAPPDLASNNVESC